MAHFGDPGIDLRAGQLPAFAGLGALGHLDLQLARIDQVFAGHAKAGRSHLFDGAVARIAVGIEDVAGRVFAAFAGVALAADAVHGDRQGFVGFLADRAVGHGAGLEALHDRFDRFHFFKRDGLLVEFELQQPAQGAQAAWIGR